MVPPHARLSYILGPLVITFELRQEKTGFLICKTKAEDQLCGYRTADQRFCFRYTDSTIPLLPKSIFSSLKPSLEALQTGLYWTCSETPNTGFLMTRLISFTVLVPFTVHAPYKRTPNDVHNRTLGVRYLTVLHSFYLLPMDVLVGILLLPLK